MQITHVAVSPERTVHKLTEEGCNNLKRLHQQMGIKGWQYGYLKDVDSLIAKVVGTNPALKKTVDENEALKQRIAELEKQLSGTNTEADAKTEAPKASTSASGNVHWAKIAEEIGKAATIEEVEAIAGNDTRAGIVKAKEKRIAQLKEAANA